MAKALVATPYTDIRGEHEVGEEVSFSLETAEQKESFEILLRYGIIVAAPERSATQARRK